MCYICQAMQGSSYDAEDIAEILSLTPETVEEAVRGCGILEQCPRCGRWNPSADVTEEGCRYCGPRG